MIDSTIAALIAAGLDPAEVTRLIEIALVEDLAGGEDVTTVATVPLGQRATLDLVARQAGIAAGIPVAAAIFESVNPALEIKVVACDGDRVERGAVLISITGPTHDLLRAERPALNLLGHLGGIATLTAAWVTAIAGTGAVLRDTRKTTPGMRGLEKYAVRCGGGQNHRMSLSDAALVKDNHVLAAGGVAQAFAAVRARFPQVPVEVEVDSLQQLDEVLAVGADLVLLDNFDLEHLRAAVQRTKGRAKLEASGGLSLGVAAEVAATGVDYLAVGALTHSAPVMDIGADLRQEI
ncbi:MAG: carboxylating nicotinate-nucleotide diphosphorylase [Candidatus Nanopelagicales bacterium]|nr:carboxylating nicotinate-nucleotide diphosphorylase [Candidatus Nanopelagicales bacterium]